MIVECNGKWVIKPDLEPPPKRKRRVTPAMAAANAANSRKSSGARTASGAARSALNATVHALTCHKLIFIEGESISDFDAEVSLWSRRLGATTEPEVAQVVTAVYCDWQARRANNAEVAAVNKKIDDLNDHFEDEKAREMWDQIPGLSAQPKKTVQLLMNSSLGCSFLANQITLLAQWMVEYDSFEVSSRAFGLNLGGYDCKDLFCDPTVMEVNRAYFAGLGGDAPFTAAEAANALQHDRPKNMTLLEFERRLERHVIDLPSVAEGKAFLQKYLSDLLQKVTQWKALIEVREDRDLLNAVGEAQVDVTPGGCLRKGYATTSKRLHFGALHMLLALKAERRKFGDGDLGDFDQEETQAPAVADPVPDPVETPQEPPAADPEPAVIEPTINEPVVTQVVGGAASNNDSERPNSVPPGVSAGNGCPAGEAIVEKYKKEFDSLREYDYLE